MNDLADLLSVVYELGIWPEDPRSEAGRARFKSALRIFRKVLEHEWVKNLLNKRQKIRIIEICGGTGIGGVGLAKVIQEKGLDIELYITDLREDALRIAESWGSEELNINIKTITL